MLKNAGVGGKVVRRVIKGIEQTHRGHTMRHPLIINSNINYESQDCKIGTVCAGWGSTSRREKVKEGD
jgi:hypothetical protein